MASFKHVFLLWIIYTCATTTYTAHTSRGNSSITSPPYTLSTSGVLKTAKPTTYGKHETTEVYPSKKSPSQSVSSSTSSSELTHRSSVTHVMETTSKTTTVLTATKSNIPSGHSTNKVSEISTGQSSIIPSSVETLPSTETRDSTGDTDHTTNIQQSGGLETSTSQETNTPTEKTTDTAPLKTSRGERFSGTTPTISIVSEQQPEVTSAKERSHFVLAKKNIKYVALGAAWGFILIVFVIIAIAVRRQRKIKRRRIVLDDKDAETLGATFYMKSAEELVLGRTFHKKDSEELVLRETSSNDRDSSIKNPVLTDNVLDHTSKR